VVVRVSTTCTRASKPKWELWDIWDLCVAISNDELGTVNC
jgi:hypothetical protein